MAIRTSLAVMHSGGLLGLEDFRVGLGALFSPASAIAAMTGFKPGPTSPAQVTASGSADAFVHVAPFQLFLASGRGAPGGVYIATMDAAASVNVLSTPADATNPRNDLVVLQQTDELYGDGTNTMAIVHVVGTPSGSPVDPAVPGSPDFVKLARVRVDANATTIVTGKITDLRPTQLYTVAVGGVLPVPSKTARDALTGTYEGMMIYRTDVDWFEFYDGTHWRVRGVAQVANAAALTNISDPYDGEIAVTLDTHSLYLYQSGSWGLLLGNSGNMRFGTVSITAVANTVTTAAVTWTALSGSTFFVLPAANSSIPGPSGVEEVSYSSPTSVGANINMYRSTSTTTTTGYVGCGF